MTKLRLTTVAAGAVVVVLGLGACTASSVESDEVSIAPTASQSEAPVTSAPSGDKKPGTKEDSVNASPGKTVPGSYITYADYLGNPESYQGTDVVLFFHAAWCSTCHAAEESIESTGVSDSLTIVKVDYDSSQDLKQQYGVTLQHTFIQIDDDGKQKAKFVGQSTVDDIVAQLA